MVLKGDPSVSGGDAKQREVWLGQELSAAARRPPKPVFGASPAALARLECSMDRLLRTCTRGAASFFHQLVAPAWLKTFLGRPPVRVEELTAWELKGEYVPDQRRLTLDEVAAALGVAAEPCPSGVAAVVPIGRCWPMGFSWSSAVALSFNVNCCRLSGFTDDAFLADERGIPRADTEVVAVAADDINVFQPAPRAMPSSAVPLG